MTIKPFNVSSTVVNSLRCLNVVFLEPGQYYETSRYAFFGGVKLPYYAINHYYQTIPITLDGAYSVENTKSCRIGDKVFDINVSGSTGTHCLATYNTNRSIEPISAIKVDDIWLPINQYGDVIFATPLVPSPPTPTAEDKIFWMGQVFRIVQVSGTWRLSANVA